MTLGKSILGRKSNLKIIAASCFALLVSVLLFDANSSDAHAGEGGASNYVPGAYGNFGVAIAPPPGFYLQNDFFYYNASAATSALSGAVSLALETEISLDMVTALWVPEYRILGAQYAAGVTVPFLHADLSGTLALAGVGATTRSVDRSAVGDLGIIPFSLFWTLSNNFHLNLYEAIILPTGPYTTSRVLNLGRNYFSFDTVLAATWLDPAMGFEISVVQGIMINTENSDTNYRTGTEYHMDWMLNQFFSPTFALGVHGYAYQQLTGDSGSGAILGDFKGEAFGVGPAFMWVPIIGGTPVKVVGKFMHEFGVRRRFSGTWGQIQVSFGL